MSDLSERPTLTVNALAGDEFICGDIRIVSINGHPVDMVRTELTIDADNIVRERYIVVTRADP